MKKVLALVLTAAMALSLAATASALTITPDTDSTTPDTDVASSFFFGDAAVEVELKPDGVSFKANADGDEFLLEDETTKYSLSSSVSSSNEALLKAAIASTKSADKKSVKLVLKLTPAKEYFTVESHDVKVKLTIIQKESVAGSVAVKFEKEYTINMSNDSHAANEFFADAEDKVTSVASLSKPVVAADVFTDVAKDKALTLDYGMYSIKFAKVAKQNTALYLKASTTIAEGSKAIASIGFKPTRVKDAATVTMPISTDNQNLYGETVYVYALVDGKPTGEAIAAEVVNHNAVIFSVPAGTTLGTYAAFGDKVQGEAEKPAIPETGANDIVNIAIVFAVVALAAAGFAAVNKASK